MIPTEDFIDATTNDGKRCTLETAWFFTYQFDVLNTWKEWYAKHTSNDEAERYFHETWDEIKLRMIGSRSFRHARYEEIMQFLGAFIDEVAGYAELRIGQGFLKSPPLSLTEYLLTRDLTKNEMKLERLTRELKRITVQEAPIEKAYDGVIDEGDGEFF